VGAALRQAVGDLWRFGRTFYARLDHGETSAYAAALTYNLLFALFPLALALAALAPVLDLSGAQQGLRSTLGAVVPPEVVRLVAAARGASANRAARASAGGAGYLLGMSAAFRRLMEAFDRAQEGDPRRRRAVWWTVLLSVLLALTLGIGLVGAMVLMTLSGDALRALLPAAAWAEAPALSAARWLILLLLAVVMLGVLYWVGPDGRRPFRLATPGALAAIAVWLSISYGFSVYLAHFNAYNALYGGFGAVILLLLYLYFLSYALLLGAEIDAMLHGTAGAPRRWRMGRPAGPRR